MKDLNKNKVIGIIGLKKTKKNKIDYEINYMCIALEYRNFGLARLLLKKVDIL
jgi:hypothetical protein